MKDSEILREARKLIRIGRVHWVCVAIQYAAGGPDKPKGKALARWVYKMLNGHALLERWLAVEHGVVFNFRKDADRERLRDCRLRWLDWMIQYCELEEAGWTPWLGDEVPPRTCSEVLFRSDITQRCLNVRDLYWGHANCSGDIIAYKP